MKIDVLAIGAHPDDVELACAGTVALLVQEGKKVGILDLTEGELGTRGTRHIRRTEAQRAAQILGVSFRKNLSLHDGDIRLAPSTVRKLITIIRHHRPSVLLFPHWLERHPDHEHAHHLCREAWFYSGLEKIRTRYEGSSQEPHRPQKYFHYMQKYEFTPSFIINTSAAFDIKMRSLMAFSSQFHNPRSRERETLLSSRLFLESIRARDIHYGSLLNVAFGEPFFSLEPVGVDSFFSLIL
jgi:bacillithiol biosynthesis deacetylase BshB1